MQSAAIYTRVSTEAQTEYSPEAKKRALFVYINHAIMQITKKLNMSGIKTKRGNKFQRMRVEYILRNPVYTGKTR